MKKTLSVLILIAILVLPITASAGGATLKSIADSIANAFKLAFAGVVIICFVYAGMMFLTAAGSPDKLAKAKSALLWGVVGTAVGLLATVAEAIVKNLFGI